MQLLLAQVLVLGPQPAELGQQRRWPATLPQMVGRVLNGARSRIATAHAQPLSPRVQRPARNPEGFLRGQEPMLLPEAQDAALLGIGADHAPAKSMIRDRKKALYAVSDPSDLHLPPSR